MVDILVCHICAHSTNLQSLNLGWREVKSNDGRGWWMLVVCGVDGTRSIERCVDWPSIKDGKCKSRSVDRSVESGKRRWDNTPNIHDTQTQCRYCITQVSHKKNRVTYTNEHPGIAITWMMGSRYQGSLPLSTVVPHRAFLLPLNILTKTSKISHRIETYLAT